MAWQTVDAGGHVTLGTSLAGTDLLSGIGIDGCSLDVEFDVKSIHPHEQGSASNNTASRQWRIQLNKALLTTGGENVLDSAILFATALYAVYKDATNTIKFSGQVTLTGAGDRVGDRGDYARQTLALISNGDPTIPAAP